MNSIQHTQTQIYSQVIAGLALLAAVAVISLAWHESLHQSATATNRSMAAGVNQVQQVVIVGHRMTADQKLAYDLAPLEVARVEIIGKRFSAEQKLAMIEADQMNLKQTAPHRKS